jgi:hypothetical protein
MQRARRCTVMAVMVLVAVVAGACGEESAGPGGTTTTTGPPVAEALPPAEWFAAELTELPDGLEPRLAQEREGEREISYNDRPGDRFDASVVVASSDPAVMPFDQIVAQLTSLGRPVVEVEVRGHRALVNPLTGDGREYGYTVMWDERPDLRITVADSRTVDGRQTATPESVVALAGLVGGLTEQEWADRVVGLGIDTHVGDVDPAVVPVEVGRGEIGGAEWVLSAYVPPGYPLGEFDQRLTCVELSHRGESSGVQCDFVPAWSVLGGTDLVFGRAPADADEVRVEPAGDRNRFEPFAVATTDELEVVGLRFFVTEMPDGACETNVVPGEDGEPFAFTAPPPGSEAIAACR